MLLPWYYSDVITQIQNFGITVFTGFIFGFDNDDEEYLDSLVDFCKEYPDVAYLSILTPFPGTPLYEFYRRNNRLKQPNNYGLFDTNHLVFNHPHLDDSKIYSLILKFYKELAFEDVAKTKNQKAQGRIIDSLSNSIYEKLINNYRRAKELYGSRI